MPSIHSLVTSWSWIHCHKHSSLTNIHWIATSTNIMSSLIEPFGLENDFLVWLCVSLISPFAEWVGPYVCVVSCHDNRNRISLTSNSDPSLTSMEVTTSEWAPPLPQPPSRGPIAPWTWAVLVMTPSQEASEMVKWWSDWNQINPSTYIQVKWLKPN